MAFTSLQEIDQLPVMMGILPGIKVK